MFQALVNGSSFEISTGSQYSEVNGTLLDWDVTSLGNGHFHVLYKGKSYRAEVAAVDRALKTVDLIINNARYNVQLRDKFDLLLEKMGMTNVSAGKVNTIKAPMPGLIIDLRVKAGDHVKAGDPLLVLEAMKMENIIKATGEGTVKQLRIKKGDTVEKGALLIEF